MGTHSVVQRAIVPPGDATLIATPVEVPQQGIIVSFGAVSKDRFRPRWIKIEHPLCAKGDVACGYRRE